MNEQPKSLTAKLATALSQMIDPPKSTQGYGYKYADLAAVNAIIRPTLAANKLAYMQPLARTSPDNQLTLTLQVLDMENGDTLTLSEMVIPEPPKKINNRGQEIPVGPQEEGSQITYYRRYQLMAAFGLAGEDDDAASVQPSPRQISTQSRPANNAPTGGISPNQAQHLWKIAQQKDVSKEELLHFCTLKAGRKITRLGELTNEEFNAIIQQIEEEEGE